MSLFYFDSSSDHRLVYDHHYDSSDDDENTVKAKTVYRRHSERDAPKSNTVGKDYLKRSKSDRKNQGSPRSLTNRSVNTLSMTVSPSAYDDRPITPMRDLMVYGKEYSSLDFKDGT